MYKKTKDIVDEYANTGLRTLYVAEKILDENEYAAWNEELRQANLQIEGREEAVDRVNEKIEKEMTLIGSTAIEDRL